jgi:hypothetical protein
MTARPARSAQLRQLYALAYAIPNRKNKKPVANAWFAKAKAMLESDRK